MSLYRLLLPAVGLALAACAGSIGRGGWTWLRPRPTPSPAELVEQLRLELIPDLNSPTGYGPRFNRAGYAGLVAWNRDIQPRESWSDDYEALDIALPCCRAAYPHRDESRNCGCGHHQALYGASKGMLERGYSVRQTQAEVNRWKAFFFPKEQLMAELTRRSWTDPAFLQAVEQVKPQGLC